MIDFKIFMIEHIREIIFFILLFGALFAGALKGQIDVNKRYQK